VSEVDPARLSARERYAWLISAIVPRPIAWVSTRSPAGASNLAPFSFYMGVSAEPPVLALAIGDRPGGAPKDTLANARDTGELVVNVARAVEAEAVVATSGDWPRGDSEFLRVGLAEAPAHSLKHAPRIAGAAVSFECVVHELVRVGTSTLLLARVVWIWADDAVLGSDGLPDPVALGPLARLGGAQYAELGPIREIQRPRV